MKRPQVPKFQKIKRRIITDIEKGTLVPGERIASEAELMRSHRVARMTAVRSLNEMVAEGYLVRVRGKGTFVRVRSPTVRRHTLAAFGLILPEMRDGFYPSLIKSFGDASRESHRQILTCDTNNSVEQQANAVLQLIDNRAAGVAMVPTTRGGEPVHHVRLLQENGIPVVFLHRPIKGASASLVAVEHDQIGRLAGDALTGAGHRRVTFFATHASSSAEAYANGLRQALRNVGSELPKYLMHFGQRVDPLPTPDHESGLEFALRKMLALPREKRPTCIFSTWGSDAESIYLTLHKMGVCIPDDISLVSVGGTWRNGAVMRRLASVIVDEGFAGRCAVQLLDEMCSGRRSMDDNYRIAIPISFNEGQTLRRIR